MKVKIVILAMFLLIYDSAFTGSIMSVQGGAVFTSYNDVRLPGDSGSDLSYKDDIDTGTGFSPRIEAGYEFDFPFYIGLMASTLRVEGEGTLKRGVNFDGKTFAAGTKVKGTYRFDSYRLTGRYYFIDDGKLKLGAGLTGKIRDAEITLEGGGEKGGLKNTGVVPLLNFYADYAVFRNMKILFYGDGAWSPYGRAEDFFMGCLYSINDNIGIMAGYRILEGGADNDEVYIFSMFHYAVFGVEVKL